MDVLAPDAKTYHACGHIADDGPGHDARWLKRLIRIQRWPHHVLLDHVHDGLDDARGTFAAPLHTREVVVCHDAVLQRLAKHICGRHRIHDGVIDAVAAR